MNMCWGCNERRDGAANPFQLTIFGKNVAFIDLNFTRTQAFNFPAFKNQACFKITFNSVIKTGFSVARDGIVVSFFLWFFSHGLLT